MKLLSSPIGARGEPQSDDANHLLKDVATGVLDDGGDVGDMMDNLTIRRVRFDWNGLGEPHDGSVGL